MNATMLNKHKHRVLRQERSRRLPKARSSQTITNHFRTPYSGALDSLFFIAFEIVDSAVNKLVYLFFLHQRWQRCHRKRRQQKLVSASGRLFTDKRIGMLHVYCLFKYLFVGCVCARCSSFEQQRIKISTTTTKIYSLFLNPTPIPIFGWWLFCAILILGAGWIPKLLRFIVNVGCGSSGKGVGEAKPILYPVKSPLNIRINSDDAKKK